MRLGIAPLAEEIAPERWPDYVLADFAPGEEEAVAELVVHACDAIEFWLEQGLERAISRFNRRIRPGDADGI
jgi:peptidyl-tRNA hydrolase